LYLIAFFLQQEKKNQVQQNKTLLVLKGNINFIRPFAHFASYFEVFEYSLYVTPRDEKRF